MRESGAERERAVRKRLYLVFLAVLLTLGLGLYGWGPALTKSASSTPIPVWTPVASLNAAVIKSQDRSGASVHNAASSKNQRAGVHSVSLPALKGAPNPANARSGAPKPLDNAAIGKLDGPAVVQVVADFGGNQVKPESGGSGTGFAVDHRLGLIVTAAHVVEGSAAIKVVLPDHERVPAVIVGRSDCDDLAVLKINTTHGLAQVKMADSSSAALGQDVVALGYSLPSLGSGLALTAGTISQLDTSLINYQDLLGVDAAINLGSSGGPIVDRQGRVIGITVLGVSGAENTHFAVATKYANPILSQLARGTNLHYIGLNLVPNSSHYQSFYGTSHGMIVVAVTSGSPADQIGVQPGDLLLRVEGSQVSDAGHLCGILDSRADGAIIKVQVYRQRIHEVLEGELVIGKLGVAGPASQNLQPIASVRPLPTPTP